MKKKLKHSELPIDYHINDMIGKGLVEKISTTGGEYIREVRRN